MKQTFWNQTMNSDLVKLWSKVVHPVANNPLPDELALPFKPELHLLVSFLLLAGFLTSLDFACSMNFSSGSCQISCARSVSRTSQCKVFTLDSEAPEFGLQLRQSQWSQQSSSAFPPGRASDPHTWTTSAPSQGLQVCEIFLLPIEHDVGVVSPLPPWLEHLKKSTM